MKHALYIHIQKIALKSFIIKKNDKRDLCYILLYIYLRSIRCIISDFLIETIGKLYIIRKLI